MQITIKGHHRRVAWVLVTLGWATCSTAAEPAATLAAKGLTKSGRVYVVDGERALAARWKDVRPTLAAYAQLTERQGHASESATRQTELEEQRLDGQNRLAELNQQILEQSMAQASQGNNRPGGGPGFGGPGGGNFGSNGPGMSGNSPGWNFGPTPLQMEREQVKQHLAEIAEEQKQLRSQATPPQDRAGLDESARKKEEQARKILSELRALVKQVDETYTGLGVDAEVKAALDDLARSTKAAVKLGPSDAHLAVVRAINQAERKLTGESTASARKGKTTAKTRSRR